MSEAYARVAPDPAHFAEFQGKLSAVVAGMPGWPDDALRGIPVPALLVFGDHDFVRLDHALAMTALIPDSRLAVLPGTTHADVLRRTELLAPMLTEFLR